MAFPTCDVTDQRILSWVNDETGYQNLRKLTCALAQPAGELIDVLDSIQMSFVLDTAVGDQLDKLGSLVGLARSGFDDTDYRRNLRIQIEIITSRLREVDGTIGNWTGTVNNILKICELFLGANTTEYTPTYPYSFKLAINEVLTVLEIQELFQLIRRALYAGVLGYTIFLLEGNNLWAHAIPIGLGDGLWDPGAVPGEALWAHALPATVVLQVSDAGGVIDQTYAFLSIDPADWFPFFGTNAVDDYCAFGFPNTFDTLVLNNASGVAGVGGDVVWEYWDGDSWESLAGVSDGSDGFTETPSDGQLVTWTLPGDWEVTTVGGIPNLYWIRARITTTYSTVPEYDSGDYGNPQGLGVWDPGAIAGEGVWNTVFSTASSNVVLANDNT